MLLPSYVTICDGQSKLSQIPPAELTPGHRSDGCRFRTQGTRAKRNRMDSRRPRQLDFIVAKPPLGPDDDRQRRRRFVIGRWICPRRTFPQDECRRSDGANEVGEILWGENFRHPRTAALFDGTAGDFPPAIEARVRGASDTVTTQERQ